jgi:predicted metal-binding membrane protein
MTNISKRLPSLSSTQKVILAVLLVLSFAAWLLLLGQSPMSGTNTMGLTMGMGATLFLAIWIVMMVAMMFPTAAPMILMFVQVQASKRDRGQPFVRAWAFVSAYLLIWALFGVVAYIAALKVEELAQQSAWVADNAARLGGAILVLTGLYQFSPLKRVCLSKCRTPLDFLLGSWRDGYTGAFRMGFEHGIYCLGCCWLLFVILFPLGIMNVAAMAVITALVFVEKVLPVGWSIARIAALILIAYGLLAIFVPGVLPTVLPPSMPSMMPM